MTIIETLVMEHRVFLTLFDQVEAALTGLQTVEEVKFLANLVKDLLHGHGEVERNLIYLALDHVLADKGQLERLNHDHRELDAGLSRLDEAPTAEQARLQLRTVMRATREHFNDEEQNAFPLIEAVLREETLVALADVWKQQSRSGKAGGARRKASKSKALQEHVGMPNQGVSYFGGAMLTT
jgi:hemerythrin-like domain-containing protein